jgi:hypothetical protein
MAGNDQDSSSPNTWQKILGILLFGVLLSFSGLVAVEIFPHNVQNARNPSFVDNIFANPAVLMAVRIALVGGAVYVLVSVVALMGGRRWLSELGPFKATAPITRLDESAVAMEADLGDALETIEDLEQRLQDSDATLAQANGHIDALLDVIDTLEGRKEGA